MARRARFPSSPSSIRFRPWIRQQVQRTARRSRRPFSEVVQDLLEEALRMRQCPGIYFADEPAGREAKVAGTGLSVWEVVKVVHESAKAGLDALSFVYIAPRSDAISAVVSYIAVYYLAGLVLGGRAKGPRGARA